MHSLFTRVAVAVLTVCLSVAAAPARRRPAAKPKRTSSTRKRIAAMPLREKVAQLVVVPFYGEAPNSRSREYTQLVRLVRDTGVGGMVLLNRVPKGVVRRAEPYALAAFTNRMQKLAKIPLIVAGDFERGPSMRVEGATPFPHAMALGATGDPSVSRYMGEVSAREARALGVQWLLVPVADVNNNPDNPVINIRSFGENPAEVSAHVRAFLEGTRADAKLPVLTTAKHFPGHGDTAIDTHLSLASAVGDRARLDAVELAPFKVAIANGVDAVMTAHIAVPALDGPDVPATLSAAVLTALLRDELGFKGLVVTDALEMGGIAKGFKGGEAAVRAIEAGADILLVPPDPVAAINAVVAAVEQGRIPRARIEQSVGKLLAAKERLGLNRERLVDVESVADAVGDPEALDRAQSISDRSVTLVRNDGDMLPLPRDGVCFVLLQENARSPLGQTLLDELSKRAPQALTVTVATAIQDDDASATSARLTGCTRVVVFSFNASGTLPDPLRRFIESLAEAKPAVLVSLGSPYLLRALPGAKAYLTTCSNVRPAEISAVRALFGEIEIGGRLPVTIPGYAEYGAGIRLPAMRPVP